MKIFFAAQVSHFRVLIEEPTTPKDLILIGRKISKNFNSDEILYFLGTPLAYVPANKVWALSSEITPILDNLEEDFTPNTLKIYWKNWIYLFSAEKAIDLLKSYSEELHSFVLFNLNLFI